MSQVGDLSDFKPHLHLLGRKVDDFIPHGGHWSQ